MPDLVVIGDCNPDVLVLGGDVTPAFGQQEKLVGQISLVIGGSAAITAVAAARLGLSVALVATVGADPAGSFMLDQLSAEGVDISAVIVRPGSATGMTVALSHASDGDSDRAILTALGAMTSLTAADVPRALLAAATSLDTNWDPAGRWLDARLSAVIAQADLILPNEAEAQALTGAPTPEAAATTLTARGPRLAVKLGPRGALCADGDLLQQVSLPPAAPVDTTGAGDCFNAGLIAGLLQGLPLPAAAALGCAAGALSARALGGTQAAPDLPTATALAKTASMTTPASTPIP